MLVNLARVVPVMVLTSASLPATPKTSLEDWSTDESWLQGFSNWSNQSFWSSWTVKWSVSLVVVETIGLPFVTRLCIISISVMNNILLGSVWQEKLMYVICWFPWYKWYSNFWRFTYLNFSLWCLLVDWDVSPKNESFYGELALAKRHILYGQSKEPSFKNLLISGKISSFDQGKPFFCRT